MNIRKIYPFLACVLLLTLASCRSSRSLEKGQAARPVASAAEYAETVAGNAQQAAALTARVKMDLNAAGRSLAVNGSLRMKRDDVIQLSLTVLGMEVGRMEFTPADVLIVDRFNKQYVRASYDQVDFLKKAELDFYALQSLFWNELFVPGERRVTGALGRFRASEAGDHTLLSLTDAPALDYAFLTVTKNGLIDRVTVESKRADVPGKLVWRYGDFETLGGKPFPATMAVELTGLDKDVSLTLALSRMNNNEAWETRTEVSSKYKQRNVADILKKLMSL